MRGTQETGDQERSWRLIPREPWVPGSHQLLVDPVLEDLAGNPVSRVLDRDLAACAGGPVQAQAVTVPFLPR